jgi:hypothetical protein
METLPDFIRVRLRQLAYDKPPRRRLLAVLRELAQEYKAFLSGDVANQNDQPSKSGSPIGSINLGRLLFDGSADGIFCRRAVANGNRPCFATINLAKYVAVSALRCEKARTFL